MTFGETETISFYFVEAFLRIRKFLNHAPSQDDSLITVSFVHSHFVESRRNKVANERHPPDGGISSSEELLEKKLGRQDMGHILGKVQPEIAKEDSKTNFFKLIRRASNMNINRGRGFTRENAFIKKN